MDQSIVLALNTLITTSITKFFALDNVMYGALYSVNTFLINGIVNFDYGKYITIFSNINWTYIYCAIIIFSVLVLMMFKKQILFYINKTSMKKYYTLRLESDSSINIFTDYVKKYNAMFQLPESYVISTGNKNHPELDTVVNFYDTNLKIIGYYIVTKDEIDGRTGWG